jgi:hypothetical protein
MFYVLSAFALLLNRLDLRLLPVGNSTASDETATLLTLDTAVHTNILVPDETPNGVAPALMARKVLVKFMGNIANTVEAGPGHGGKVVVLVVKTDVVCEPVERSIVGEGLGDGNIVVRVTSRRRDGLVNVVLSNEVTG